ncbi:MAG: hypothetical protein K2H45_14970 [Acetatifactor sp.]|nr:hypothetical protein [Acetatifactor sp.]
MEDKGYAFANYIINNWWQILIVLIIGVLIGYIVSTFAEHKKISLKNLDNIVIYASFFIAVLCLFLNTVFENNMIYTSILSFYSSFVFSWQLTKKSSKEEFKERQHEIAKNTHRHIQDIETAALVTKRRVKDILTKSKIEKTDIEGLQDDIEIILAGIRTNEHDWEDMMTEEYLEKLRKGDDPEAKLKKEEVYQPSTEKLMNIGNTVNSQKPEVNDINTTQNLS